MNMKYCTNCGAQVAEGARFCGHCGTPIVDIADNREKETEKIECRIETVSVTREELNNGGQKKIEIDGAQYEFQLPKDLHEDSLVRIENSEEVGLDREEIPVLIKLEPEEEPLKEEAEEMPALAEPTEAEPEEDNQSAAKPWDSFRLTSKDKGCSWCGKKSGLFGPKYNYKGGYLCYECAKKFFLTNSVVTNDSIAKNLKKMTKEECDRYLEQVQDLRMRIDNFSPTYRLQARIQFDDDTETLMLEEEDWTKTQFIKYNQIVDFELLENGGSLAKGGVGRAVVGGMLFGSTGAIVGSTTRKQKKLCESLCIKLTLKDFEEPSYYINFIKKPVDVGSEYYKDVVKKAQDMMSKLQLITSSMSAPVQEDTGKSMGGNAEANADPIAEIRGYKALYDEGILTEEEFQQKKKQILGI